MNDLLSSSEEDKKKAARQLLIFVSNRFLEYTQDHIGLLLRELEILLNSPKLPDKRGGIYAAVVLLRLEVSPSQKLHIHSRIRNSFQSLLVQEEHLQILISQAIGYISRSENRGTNTIGHQFWLIAIDWLSTKGQIDIKRVASLLIIKELTFNAPSFYHYKLEDFYDICFSCISDIKPLIRETAISALKACLHHSASREVDSSSSPPWKILFNNGQDYIDNANPKDRALRDDRSHCYILLVTELLRISSLPSQTESFAPFFSSEINVDFLGADYTQSPTYSFTTLVESLQVSYRSYRLNYAHPYSERCKHFISKHYNNICTVVFKNLTNKSILLSSAIINIFPWLALFDPQTFVLNYIQPATDYLISLTNDKDRAPESFNALGLLILALRDSIKLPKTFLKCTIDAVWSKISTESSKKYRDVDPAVYQCISYLLRSKINGLDSYKKVLVDQLENMSIRLSSGLVQVLQDIIATDSKLKKTIQQHLLQYLFLILVHKPIHHPGIQRGSSSIDIQCTPSPSTNNQSDILLSLETLSEFEFNDMTGIAFYLKIVANTFLKHCEKLVRIQTIKSCCKLLEQTIPSPSIASSLLIQLPTQQASTQNVSDILNMLLKVGVTDQDNSVRLCVFCSLTTKFDGHLAQAENLEKLFAAFQDESFEIRLQVLCILGRLNVYNPAYLLPSLRKTLVQLLDDLRLTNATHLEEQSAQLLACLITHTPVLVKPYYEPILDSLIPKLRLSNAPVGVVMSVLQAIAMQAKVSQSEMKMYSSKIIPILRDNIQDASSISTDKTLLALWTIGELLEHTHYVLESSNDRPHMMNILFSFLKVELHPSIRLQCIRVLGLLGALDPHKYLAFHLKQDAGLNNLGKCTNSLQNIDIQNNATGNLTSEIWVSTSSALLEDFYPQVAIKCLLRILNDASLSTFHPEAAMALPIILEYLDDKAPHYIKLILPTILPVIELNPDAKLKNALLSQLKRIIAIAGPQAKDYMPKIFDLIKKSWNSGVNQKALIELIKQLITTLGSEFRNFLPQLVQPILGVLLEDDSSGKQNTIELLKALQACGPNIDDFLHMLLPPVIKLLERTGYNIDVVKESLTTIKKLSSCIDFNDFVSPIVHALVRTIEHKEEVRFEALNVLIGIIPELGHSYEIFIPMVNAVLEKFDIFNSDYNYLIQQIAQEKQNWCIRHSTEVSFLQHALSDNDHKNEFTSQRKLTPSLKGSYMNILSLSKAWDTSDNVSVEAWTEWLRRLSLQFVQETPDKALRALHQICTSYNILAREIFNATFITCWANLPPFHKDDLVSSIEKALKNSNSPEIVQIILNLVEFTEHLEIISIPLDNELLCDCAYQSRAFAKAVRYKEKEFKTKTISKDILESLIDLNNKLQVSEASLGVLEFSKKMHGIIEDAKWYESLQCWDQALDIYRNYQYTGKESINVTIGKLRCLDALGEWEELYECTLENWNKASEQNKRVISQIACSAAWGLNKWEKLNDFIELIPSHSYNGAFYRAVMAIYSEDYEVSKSYIQQARELLDPELSVLVADSYTRAYDAMILVQNLSELEEVIDAKIDPSPNKLNDLIETWWNRLQGCNYNVDDWQKILLVRSLIVKPTQDTRSWIKYASLCKKNKRLRRAKETLINIGADQFDCEWVDPNVNYAYIKFKWNIIPILESSNKKPPILEEMFKFTKRLLTLNDSNMVDTHTDLSILLAKCFLRLGMWNWELCKTLNDPSNMTRINNILAYLKSSTEYNPASYKAWHAWAIFNFELGNQQDEILISKSPIYSRNSHQAHIYHTDYVKNAIEGFLRSISLSNNSLQDSLRLLTLWFSHAGQDDVFETLGQGIKTVSIDTWLQVIPQLIARIDSPILNVKKLIHNLLVDLGREHPQALVFPITVASKSNVKSRAEAAKSVLDVISDTKYDLALQANLVSEELIRVAILWHEQWHEGLEEASRLYFADKNVTGMLNILEPLHMMLENGPQTLNEMSFSQAYGRDLSDAQDWCKKYQNSISIKDLTQAWELYFHVFKRISKQLPLLVSLDLKSVSSKLFQQRNMVLPVPGTYLPGHDIIYIQEFSPSLQVIPSKQRPRKLSLKGCNGKDFQFLLKGHEDLRQDARVMQLFGLVNTLLVNNSETFKKELFIQRYSVIPLSPNSGLIGWVPNCDTMHALIKDFRDRKNVVLNIEHRLMLKYSPDYECLPLLQKVEVFERALEERNGEDLSDIMWLKSPNSEVWFTRRTNYTRSLAVMSMVGYILGLGDRHPSNLMIDRLSGRVLHIDFGDCFEVAMTREKFPEKIPFRLTRMLVKAMEVTGIDGTFKHTCINVMAVLRNNSDSVMAVLEAFVYDPLLSWKLVDTIHQKGNLARQGLNSLPAFETSDQQDIEDITLHPKRPTNLYNQISNMDEDEKIPKVELNQKALEIKSRIKDKLNGLDFSCQRGLVVEEQVQLLVHQATSHENLCQCYIGWCPFW